MQGFDVGGDARHQFAGAAVVEEAQTQVLQMVVDLHAQIKEDVLPGAGEEVAVDEAEEGAQDIDAEQGQGQKLEQFEVLGYMSPVKRPPT